MDSSEWLVFTSSEEWRRWLSAHHEDKEEVWLLYYKKDSGKTSISYDESVEEAICFGWIDSRVKAVDNEKFVRRFTPRKKGSGWSQYNLARARKMIKEGRMTKAGIALLPEKLQAEG